MSVTDGDHAQEEEDDAIGERAHRLDCVLDGGVALLRNVRECISFLSYATGNLKKDQNKTAFKRFHDRGIRVYSIKFLFEDNIRVGN